MSVLEKSIFVIAVGIFVYLWNKYAVTKLIEKFVKLNHQNRWLAKNENRIIAGIQLFYWLFYLLFILAVLVSK
ncbi:hypothetical protein [Psychroflexus sediminis]|uniref:Uncharacterized protein n=1 Tax=Psychroflexus sediminis TaxID=470826 RepID=A0A1G7VV75_9FLAO|nr:hypothetical protein [Psychroflexus sediminis]SDG62770.1 hypothetical protein SAMN04488027_104118 [Psychroflexus sediminis]